MMESAVMTTNKFNLGLEKSAELLQQAIGELAIKNEKENLLIDVPNFEDFQTSILNLLQIIGEDDWGYRITLDGDKLDGDNESKAKVEEDVQKFNSTMEEKSRDYLLLLVLQLTLQTYLDEYCEYQKTRHDEGGIKIEEYTIGPKEMGIFNKMALVLDLQLQIYLGNLPSTKGNFYQLILQATEALQNLGSFGVDKFFFYLESRQTLIQQKLFDPKLTSDRISILEICNGLTDRYYPQNSINGKRDSYKKDSFNDRLQYRVRTFITNVFQFEDNTGLNKYFTNANRVVRESAPVKAKSWEDELLQDLVKFSKIIRDPYFYLKPNNSRQLSSAIETLAKLYDFLFEEEDAYAKNKPKTDQFLVKPEKSKSEQEYLKEKYEKKVFFPESYWLSPFEANQRNTSYELQREDEKYFMKQLADTKTRHVLVVQIYLIACLFYHLVGSNRRALLKDIGAPANVKHLTDDSIPESYVNELFKIRREILKKYRSVDNQLGFLLQQLQNSELNWWGWLIYSKDAKGVPLHTNRQLTDEELAEVAKKTEIVVPYKEKRYFNIYATPQLSRKMKVQTGLDKLKVGALDGMDEEDRIGEITEKINGSSGIERERLVEQRTIMVWKQLKTQRQTRWLDFGLLLTKEMLTDVKREQEEQKRAQEEAEEQKQAKEIEKEKVQVLKEEQAQKTETSTEKQVKDSSPQEKDEAADPEADQSQAAQQNAGPEFGSNAADIDATAVPIKDSVVPPEVAEALPDESEARKRPREEESPEKQDTQLPKRTKLE